MDRTERESAESTSTDSEMKKLFDLIETGEKELKNVPEEVILVLGLPGSGKTTLAELLTKDNGKMFAVQGDFGNDYIIEDEDQKIRNRSSILSKTIYPELMVNTEVGVAFYDCPAFGNTRGTIYDIAGTYLIKKVIESAKKVKFVLTFDYSSMRNGADQRDVVELIGHTLRLIRNFDEYANSIALIVTKVETNISIVDVKQITGRYLKQFKEHVGEFFESELAENAKKLIDTLQQTESDSSVILKVTDIFQNPGALGPLSSQFNKKYVESTIYELIKYASATASDFGYTVSNNSKIRISKMLADIDNSIRNLVERIGTGVRRHWETEETESDDVYSLYHKLRSAYEKTRNFSNNTAETLNSNDFANSLREFARQLGANVAENRWSDLRRRIEYRQFLERISEKKFANPFSSWKTEVGVVEQYLSNSKKWYKFEIRLYENLVSYDVQKNKTQFSYLRQEPITRVNDTNLRRFVETQCTNVQFEDVLDLETDATKMASLNRIVRSTLANDIVSQYRENSSTYEIRGDWVKLTDVVAGPDFGKAAFVNVFATRKLFYDTDLPNSNENLRHVSIVAPTWEIVDHRREVVLDGGCTCHRPHLGVPSAGNGSASDATFFGVGARFVNADGLLAEWSTGGGNGSEADGCAAAEDDVLRASMIVNVSSGGPTPTWHFTWQDGVNSTGGRPETINATSGANNRNAHRSTAGGPIRANNADAAATFANRSTDSRQDGRPGGAGQPNLADVLVEYKAFFEGSLTNERTKRGELLEFRNRLNENTSAIEAYGVARLAGEFFGLEKRYAECPKTLDLLPRYERLLGAVEDYRTVANSKGEENSTESGKMLSTLYRAVLSRICVIRGKPSNRLITDVGKYLDSIANTIREKKYAKREYIDNYRSQISNTVEETISFLRKNVTPTIENLSKQLQENVSSLLDRTSSAKRNGEPRYEDLLGELEHNFIVTQLARVPKQMTRLLDLVATRAREALAKGMSTNSCPKFDVDGERNVFRPLAGTERAPSVRNVSTPLPSTKSAPSERNVLSTSLPSTESAPPLHSQNETRMKKIYETRTLLAYVIREMADKLAHTPFFDVMYITGYQRRVDDTYDERIFEVEQDLKDLLEALLDPENQDIKMEVTEVLRGARNAILRRDFGMADLIKKDVLNMALDNVVVCLTKVHGYVEELEGLTTRIIDTIDANYSLRENSPRIMFNDAKMLMKKLGDEYSLPEGLVSGFEKIEKGTDAIVNVYEHLRYYQRLRRVVLVPNTTNSCSATDDVTTPTTWSNEQLRKTFENLSQTIESNLPTLVYREAIKTLNEIRFPFAHLYAPAFDLNSNGDADAISDKLLQIKWTMESDERCEQYLYGGAFGDTLGPFYTWRNEHFGKAISNLLAGKEVLLKADVWRGVTKNAVKFDEVGIYFKVVDEAVQKQLDDDLKGFQVRMTHSGYNSYRCDKDYYVFGSEKQTLVYSYERNDAGEPTSTNKVYDKIKEGGFVLSPYTYWSLQLKGSNFEKLKRYETLVDLELNGEGQFVEDANICDGALIRNYYTPEEDYAVSDDHHRFDDQENRFDLRDVKLQLPGDVPVDEVRTPDTRRANNRKRRSIDDETASNGGEGDEKSSLERKGLLNWVVNGFRKDDELAKKHVGYSVVQRNPMLPGLNDHQRRNAISSIAGHFNVNDTLILTDLLVRSVTKRKSSRYFQECSANFESARACALDIITKFENILETMSRRPAQFEFDPVPLMAALETEVVNGDGRKVGEILLNALADKSEFDENEFYRGLKTSTGGK